MPAGLPGQVVPGVVGQAAPAAAGAQGATGLASPEAAYEQAIAPVDITHRAISNWSDAETGALAVAVRQAQDACAARGSVVYAGDALIGYARLCALGQQWPTVVGAATAYLHGADPAKPKMAQAYGYLVEGALRMNDERAALKNGLDMLGAVPYTTLTDDVMSEALRYLQLAFTADALVLAGVRERSVVKLLHDTGQATAGRATAGQAPAGRATAGEASGSAAAVIASETGGAARAGSADPVLVRTLYADGLWLAGLQQYNGEMAGAAATVEELEAAIPSTVSADDALAMSEDRRQYRMLGTKLPEIAAAASLFSPTETPRINRQFGTATILLLFPPWCGQCVRTAKDVLPAMFRLNSEGAEVHLYGLLASDPPPTAAPGGAGALAKGGRRGRPGSAESSAAQAAPEKPPAAAELLRGTPTLVVSPSTLAQFGATDVPFVIATDHDGVMRLLLPGAPENAMAAGSTIDQIAAHLATQWPVDAPKN